MSRTVIYPKKRKSSGLPNGALQIQNLSVWNACNPVIDKEEAMEVEESNFLEQSEKSTQTVDAQKWQHNLNQTVLCPPVPQTFNLCNQSSFNRIHPAKTENHFDNTRLENTIPVNQSQLQSLKNVMQSSVPSIWKAVNPDDIDDLLIWASHNQEEIGRFLQWVSENLPVNHSQHQSLKNVVQSNVPLRCAAENLDDVDDLLIWASDNQEEIGRFLQCVSENHREVLTNLEWMSEVREQTEMYEKEAIENVKLAYCTDSEKDKTEEKTEDTEKSEEATDENEDEIIFVD